MTRLRVAKPAPEFSALDRECGQRRESADEDAVARGELASSHIEQAEHAVRDGIDPEHRRGEDETHGRVTGDQHLPRRGRLRDVTHNGRAQASEPGKTATA